MTTPKRSLLAYHDDKIKEFRSINDYSKISKNAKNIKNQKNHHLDENLANRHLV
jgi:hypothetical protein